MFYSLLTKQYSLSNLYSVKVTVYTQSRARDNSAATAWPCFFVVFLRQVKVPTLPWDLTVLHNDPAAPQDHCGKCLIRTRDFCPRSLARYQMSHHIFMLLVIALLLYYIRCDYFIKTPRHDIFRFFFLSLKFYILRCGVVALSCREAPKLSHVQFGIYVASLLILYTR